MTENTINIMRCPFRTDKDGNFCECYGKACMAYFRYEHFSPDQTTTIRQTMQNPVVTHICKRMPQPVTYGGCV